MTAVYAKSKVKKMTQLAVKLGLADKADEVEQKLRIDFIRAVAYGRLAGPEAAEVAKEVLESQYVKFDRAVHTPKRGKTNREKA